MIRAEQPEDVAAIDVITIAAFAGSPHSDQTEHLIVRRLRVSGALAVSMVAEVDGKVIGHIAFSTVTISGEDIGWYGLGPVSVRPDARGQGIGSALVREGLDILRRRGARGCVVLGDPAFYGRFGFARQTWLTLPDVPPEYFTVLPLREVIPSGIVAYNRGFYGEAP